jgi:hypothetical protein
MPVESSLIPRRRPEGTPSHPAWEKPGYREHLEEVEDVAVDLLTEVLTYLSSSGYELPSADWFIDRYLAVLQYSERTEDECSLYDVWCLLTFFADANVYHQVPVTKTNFDEICRQEHYSDQIATLALDAMHLAGHKPR